LLRPFGCIHQHAGAAGPTVEINLHKDVVGVVSRNVVAVPPSLTMIRTNPFTLSVPPLQAISSKVETSRRSALPLPTMPLQFYDDVGTQRCTRATRVTFPHLAWIEMRFRPA